MSTTLCIMAVVTHITGQAFAVSPDGSRRTLGVGDSIFLGERVQAATGGGMALLLANGQALDLHGSAHWLAVAPTETVAPHSLEPRQAHGQSHAQTSAQAETKPAEGVLACTQIESEPIAHAPSTSLELSRTPAHHSYVLLHATAGSVVPAVGYSTAKGYAPVEQAPPSILTRPLPAPDVETPPPPPPPPPPPFGDGDQPWRHDEGARG
jgi:hypothetical protein